MTTIAVSDERVVLLDADGRPCGNELKRAVHDDSTRLHLAWSCYVVNHSGRVLLTRRSRRKLTCRAYGRTRVAAILRPVVAALVDAEPVLNLDEVEEARWCSWAEIAADVVRPRRDARHRRDAPSVLARSTT